jgi:hypothetical protein
VTFKKEGLSGFLINMDKSKLTSSDEGSFKIKVTYFNTKPGALWKQKNYEIVMNIDLGSTSALVDGSAAEGGSTGEEASGDGLGSQDADGENDGTDSEAGLNKDKEKEQDKKDAAEAKTEIRIKAI